MLPPPYQMVLHMNRTIPSTPLNLDIASHTKFVSSVSSLDYTVAIVKDETRIGEYIPIVPNTRL